MIAVCTGYLETFIKSLQIVQVCVGPEDAAKHLAIPYAVITRGPESMQYNGSLVARADGPGVGKRTFRRKIFDRLIQVKVKIVHRDQAAADAAATAFLAGVQRRILDAGANAILISAKGAEPEDDTSLLKQQNVEFFLVTFEGGVYSDHVVNVYDLDTAQAIEGEITKEV